MRARASFVAAMYLMPIFRQLRHTRVQVLGPSNGSFLDARNYARIEDSELNPLRVGYGVVGYPVV